MRRAHPTLPHLAILLVVAQCFAGQVLAQQRYTPLPQDDAQAQKMLEDVSKRVAPRPQFAYQAYLDAQASADSYASIAEQREAYLKELIPAKARYPKDSATLKQHAQSCSPANVKQLIRDIANLGAGSDDFVVPVTDSDSTGISALADLDLMDPAQQCAKLKQDKTWADLSSTAMKGFDAAIARATSDSKHARDLEAAWRAKAEEFQKKSSETPSLDLVANLPWIVGIVAIFAVGLIAVGRLFEQAVQDELVKSGQIIQLPTVMILLITILVLALGGKIQENTIGTLLGGLAGYVLARGIGRYAARAAGNPQTEPGTSPSGGPTPTPTPALGTALSSGQTASVLGSASAKSIV